MFSNYDVYPKSETAVWDFQMHDCASFRDVGERKPLVNDDAK